MSRWRNPKEINLIVIHCSADENGTSTRIEEIDHQHNLRGFKRAEGFRQRQNMHLEAIGYHFIIVANGAIFTGRHLEETGAHVRGYNRRSIGVCLIGTDQFTLNQWRTLAANIQGLQQHFSSAHVVGHRDMSPDLDGDGVIKRNEWLKICPGFDVQAWIDGGMKPMADHLLEDEA